ncbi:MAG: hypothetical protein LBT04_01515, partial [Prevotellaceae bacterium]|nr:hypothetical protein [Prevotellaceae bacterium]
KLCILMLVVSGMFVSCEGFPTVEKPNNALVGSWERKGSYIKILCDSPWQERMDEIVAMLRVEFFNTLTFKNDGSGLFTISSTDPEKMFYYSLTDDEITATAEDLIYGFNAGSIDVSGETFIMSYDIEGNTLNVKMDITERMKEALGRSVYGIDPNAIEVAHIAGTYIRK